MGSEGREDFIAGGRGRLLGASTGKIEEIEKRIRARYAEALAAAGIMERLQSGSDHSISLMLKELTVIDGTKTGLTLHFQP